MTPPDLIKDRFTLYIVIAVSLLVASILAVKMNEDDKFAPIKHQINEEIQQMNIRVIDNRSD